jgi:homoserine/homoserine lactone efflux protein
MDKSQILILLAYAVPLIISPGPGNALLTSLGGRYGVTRTIPFWAGFEGGNLILCLLYGFGLGKFFQDHTDAQNILRWVGILYTVYLAWKFVSSPAVPQDTIKDSEYRFNVFDGTISVLLNPKIHSMIMVMFSQFIDFSQPTYPQVLSITVIFVVVGVPCHFIWIYAGKLILSRFQSRRALLLQNWFFGLCMIAVAISMAWPTA